MTWRFQRMPTVPAGIALLGRLAAIVLALACVALILALAGRAPVRLGAEVIGAAFGSVQGLEDLGLLVTPLILTGVAVALTQRIGLWNIGGEGQFNAGALAATAVGLGLRGDDLVVLPLMALAGAAGGAAWILVPTLARALAGVSELITTLLLNFVAALLVAWLCTGPWRDPSGLALATTARIPAELPPLGEGLHWGLPIALAVAVLAAGLLAFTRFGYEVRIAGANPGAALYAGIPVRTRIIAVMLLSGAVAGLAGMIELAGTVHRLQGGISNNYGYLGIMVAVLARGSCLGVIVGAVLMAALLNAGITLQTQGVNTSTVLAITGLILLFTAIGDELAHYRPARRARAMD
ncbi:ABC transporter permease [Methylobacterium sp. Leaf89]|uniref:ABC transporter permease n=1 Tax=Methylobacterium sp. Leaf89 TaxID=1736245 RepID=UPI0006F7AA8B|nr:ABC transporter permease [Methylobacterium sp. Leaf89]KQO73599.1 sugar ABC transporter [Methylobacterium sp. Leaf89]